LRRRVETVGLPPERVQTPFRLEIRESTDG
jgi:hypothetical protein